MRHVFFFLFVFFFAHAAFAVEQESVYDRVIRTGIFRCGYGVWEPIMMKDPNTGALSGIFYDYMNALGKNLNLKIEWVEETDWATFGQSLDSGRIDGFCLGIWPSGSRARTTDFTTPIYYNPFRVYVRADDARFDHALDKINDEAITISRLDGDSAGAIAELDYPNAKILASPQMAGSISPMVNVTEGKADVSFIDAASLASYMAKNPGKLKVVPGGEVIRSFGSTIAIKRNEYPLKTLLDTATDELMQAGVIEKILVKYEKYPGTLLRVAKPYMEAR